MRQTDLTKGAKCLHSVLLLRPQELRFSSESPIFADHDPESWSSGLASSVSLLDTSSGSIKAASGLGRIFSRIYIHSIAIKRYDCVKNINLGQPLDPHTITKLSVTKENYLQIHIIRPMILRELNIEVDEKVSSLSRAHGQWHPLSNNTLDIPRMDDYTPHPGSAQQGYRNRPYA